MGIYQRPDSRFWWVCLEQQGQRPIRETTGILVRGATPAQTSENKRLAEELYGRRMTELLRQRINGAAPKRERRRGERSDRWSYLYFIGDGQAIKIGRAVNIERRLRSLRTAQHRDLAVLAAVPVHVSTEAAVHRRFSHLRIKGLEWFRPEPELLDFIERVKAGGHPAHLLFAT